MEIQYWNSGRKFTEQQKTNVALWLEALRSGNFSQCQGELCRGKENGHSFCCLGVAVNVFNLAVDNLFAPKMGGFFRLFGFNYLENVCAIVPDGQKIGIGRYLVDLNDKDLLDFNQIADVIERYVGL